MEAECGCGDGRGGDGNGDRTSAKCSSDGKGREGLPPVKVPEWKELVDRAEAALDDEGEAKMEKRRKAAGCCCTVRMISTISKVSSSARNPTP